MFSVEPGDKIGLVFETKVKELYKYPDDRLSMKVFLTLDFMHEH